MTRQRLDAFKGATKPAPAGQGASAAPAPADDRKVATLRLSRPAWRQLKDLALDLEVSEQKLLALAANMLFRTAGLPELAEDAYDEDLLRIHRR